MNASLRSLSTSGRWKFGFERSLRPQDSFKSAMISLENVVQVFHLPVLHRLRADSLRFQLGYCLGQSWCLVGVDDPRRLSYSIAASWPGNAWPPRHCASERDKVQGLPTGGNRPVEIAPRAADPDIGLIHPPGTGLPVGYLPVHRVCLSSSGAYFCTQR